MIQFKFFFRKPIAVVKGESLLKSKFQPITTDPLQKVRANIEKLKAESARKSDLSEPVLPSRSKTLKTVSDPSDCDSVSVQKCLVTIMKVENKVLDVHPQPKRKTTSKLDLETKAEIRANVQSKFKTTAGSFPEQQAWSGDQNSHKPKSRQTKTKVPEQTDTEEIQNQIRSRKRSNSEAKELSERSRKRYFPLSEEKMPAKFESKSRKRGLPQRLEGDLLPQKKIRTDSEEKDWLDSQLDSLLEVLSKSLSEFRRTNSIS